MQNKLVDDYAAQAIAYGEAANQYNALRTNRCYDQVIGALGAIDKAGMRTALVVLLEHPNAWVRCWSATHLLPYKEEEAKLALSKAVEAKIRRVSFDAKMVLQEWEKGTLKVP